MAPIAVWTEYRTNGLATPQDEPRPEDNRLEQDKGGAVVSGGCKAEPAADVGWAGKTI